MWNTLLKIAAPPTQHNIMCLLDEALVLTIRVNKAKADNVYKHSASIENV